MDLKEIINRIKKLSVGDWMGEGFAKFPTIDDTAYTEVTVFIPDEHKDAILFNQKTWYKNNTSNNGQTVFWDTGFILLKENDILLHSVQVGGRMEQYKLTSYDNDHFVFDSVNIQVDPKTIHSQRIFTFEKDSITYELNMSTHQATEFQNHLKARLVRHQ
ncbi:heme-binding beta-barrel domain-containing protein [Mucilaginibacter sp. SG564]|uniref:heme-binding beta-barrel domain-containing protein n=1 Tax=Mucilaginibacter sp. SG564 TaxID=2587022 RepID=UPI0015530000|nr:heme-binding beta-barrel domain-containing protein [Mucilaginibacter sp. SG564]NOW96059.1 hypothetical protein [Mucilaginibacter sp. SG564]